VRTRDVVEAQLEGYEEGSETAGANFKRSDELVGWVQFYEGKDGKGYCVWGDRDPIGAIFFAQVGGASKIPNWVRKQNSLCGAPDYDPEGSPWDDIPSDLDIRWTNDEVEDEEPADPPPPIPAPLPKPEPKRAPAPVPEPVPVPQARSARPIILPAVNVAVLCRATWTVVVERAATDPITLRMEYGDGFNEDRTVAPGSGVATLSFEHEFPPYFPLEVVEQRATILENGRSSTAYTVHPDPFGQSLLPMSCGG